MMLESELLVVTGAPRSGTTLVNRMICGANQCSPFIPECTFIGAQIALYANILQYADKERFSTYFKTKEECHRCFKQCLDAHLESLLRSTSLNTKRYDFLVLKDPMLSLHLKYAQELLPDKTRFIVVIRNPFSVLASLKNVSIKKGEKWDIKKAVLEMENFYYQINLHKDHVNNDLTHFVRYEDVVNGNAYELENFLGFRINQQLSDLNHFHEKKAGVDPFLTRLYGQPVSNERVKSYKNELSWREVNYIKKTMAGILSCWNYKHS